MLLPYHHLKNPYEHPITELKNTHVGQDIYVLGSAASMDYVDPTLFEDRIAIGVNYVFRKFPVDYTVGKELSTAEIEEASITSKVILSRHKAGSHEKTTQHIETKLLHYVFEHKHNKCTRIDWSILGTDEIVVSYSTITSAIHIAAYMGAKNIFLLGADGGLLNGKTNYTGYYDNIEVNQSWYNGWVKEILPQTTELRDRLRETYGCRVMLLSPFLNFLQEGHNFK